MSIEKFMSNMVSNRELSIEHFLDSFDGMHEVRNNWSTIAASRGSSVG